MTQRVGIVKLAPAVQLSSTPTNFFFAALTLRLCAFA